MRKNLLNGSLLTLTLVASPSLRAEESMVDKGQQKFNNAVDTVQGGYDAAVDGVKSAYKKVHNLKMPEVEMSEEGEKLLMGGAPVGEGSGSLKAWEAETKAVVKAGYSLKLALLLYGRDNADAKSLLKMNEQLLALDIEQNKNISSNFSALEGKINFDAEKGIYVPSVEGADRETLRLIKDFNDRSAKSNRLEARMADLRSAIAQKTESLQSKLKAGGAGLPLGSLDADGKLTPAGLEIVKSNGARWSKAFGGIGVAITAVELGVDTFNVFQNKETPGLIPMQASVELVKAQVK